MLQCTLGVQVVFDVVVISFPLDMEELLDIRLVGLILIFILFSRVAAQIYSPTKSSLDLTFSNKCKKVSLSHVY